MLLSKRHSTCAIKAVIRLQVFSLSFKLISWHDKIFLLRKSLLFFKKALVLPPSLSLMEFF